MLLLWEQKREAVLRTYFFLIFLTLLGCSSVDPEGSGPQLVQNSLSPEANARLQEAQLYRRAVRLLRHSVDNNRNDALVYDSPWVLVSFFQSNAALDTMDDNTFVLDGKNGSFFYTKNDCEKERRNQQNLNVVASACIERESFAWGSFYYTSTTAFPSVLKISPQQRDLSPQRFPGSPSTKRPFRNHEEILGESHVFGPRSRTSAP